MHSFDGPASEENITQKHNPTELLSRSFLTRERERKELAKRKKEIERGREGT